MKDKVASSNSLTRALINRSTADGRDVQMTWLSGRVTPDVENFQPQGLYFRLPAKSEGIAVAPGGIADNAVIVGASQRSTLPADALLEGEGGLHYLGAYKVFLTADGTVAIGAKLPADFAARASLTNARITALQAKLDALIAKFNTHTHVYNPGPSAPAATLVPAVLETALGAQASVASLVVKIS